MLSILMFSDIIWNLTELQMSRAIIKGKYLLIINRQRLRTSMRKKTVAHEVFAILVHW